MYKWNTREELWNLIRKHVPVSRTIEQGWQDHKVVLSVFSLYQLCPTLEGIAYGIAFVLYVKSVGSFKTHSVEWAFHVAATLIFVMATLHLVAVIIRTFRGFVSYPAGPEAYFRLLDTPENVLAQVGQVGAILLSDLLSVYRVYRICNHNTLAAWVLDQGVKLVATAGFLATLVSAAIFVSVQRTTDQETNYFQDNVYRWKLAFLGVSLFTTAFSTVSISFVLWTADRALRDEAAGKPMPSLPRRALRIFVESAALYSTNNLLYLLLLASKSIVETLFSTVASSVASITFCLISLRLSRELQNLGLLDNAESNSRDGVPLEQVGHLPDDPHPHSS